jgi:glutamate 5-kinase
MKKENQNKKEKLFVLKIGSSLITSSSGEIDINYINLLARTIYENVLENGDKLIIVTSGAIATGIGILGLKEKPKEISKKQALAAIGQVELMNIYKKAFARYTKMVAQVLLTKSQLDNRERYLNIKNTIFELLDLGFIPIINENDTVSISEIKFGDNDTLSALVAARVNADMLVILTDVDGVYTSNPRIDEKAELIKIFQMSKYDEMIKKIDFSSSKKTGSKVGTGGMETKFKAAKISCLSGVPVFITNGRNEANIKNLFKSFDIGTKFVPDDKIFSEKERWFAFNAHINGTLIVDKGAEDAIKNKGKSLLPAGIINIEGNFVRGDVVNVKNLENIVFAKGTAEYSSDEIEEIKGLNQKEIIEKKSNKKNKKNVVLHRDNMVVL